MRHLCFSAIRRIDCSTVAFLLLVMALSAGAHPVPGDGVESEEVEPLKARIDELEEALAEKPNDFSLRLALAKAQYFKALAGEAKLFWTSQEGLEQLREEEPDHATVTVYLGSIRLIESARTLALWNKNRLAKEGLTMIDDAVDASEGDPEVRFIRAMSTYHLPRFFRRAAQSEQDFALLAAQATDDAKAGRLEPELAAAGLYHHALFCMKRKKVDDARDAWAEAIEIAPESLAGRDSAKKLEKHGLAKTDDQG